MSWFFRSVKTTVEVDLSKYKCLGIAYLMSHVNNYVNKDAKVLWQMNSEEIVARIEYPNILRDADLDILSRLDESLEEELNGWLE